MCYLPLLLHQKGNKNCQKSNFSNAFINPGFPIPLRLSEIGRLEKLHIRTLQHE
jgi:hypothetical protein